MEAIKTTSLQAENANFICKAITDYIGKKLAVPAEFIDYVPWQERKRRLDAGEIHLSWLCGLPYVREADQVNPNIELLVAPVMRHKRYQKRPIYFSDVVVHRDSDFHTFADLRGGSWAYNEPNSHSGYNLTGYHLAKLGEGSDYFSKIVEAGAHQTALEMVLNRQIDGSAIDSTVLEQELARSASLKDQLRIIEVFGPSPIPPWVILRSVPSELRYALRQVFLQMHQDSEGQAILKTGHMERFVPVADQDYDPIRHMAQRAESVKLQQSG